MNPKNINLDKRLLPSEEQVIEYKQKGWFIGNFSIPEKLIDDAIKGAHEFYEGKRDFKLPNIQGIENDALDPKAVLRNNEFVTLQKKELQALGFHTLITETAAKLAQTNEIRLFADSLINKLPTNINNEGVIGWHSDKAYWPTCTSQNMVTAWIPLQDCTIDMGPLFHIDESNNWNHEEALKSFFSFNNQDLSTFENYLLEHKPTHTRTPMLLKKGQVSFHNCNTIHASYPNTSNTNRMALAIHFQDGANKYQKAYKENGELIEIGYDKICVKDVDGNPDYSDPNMFPKILEL